MALEVAIPIHDYRERAHPRGGAGAEAESQVNAKSYFQGSPISRLYGLPAAKAGSCQWIQPWENACFTWTWMADSVLLGDIGWAVPSPDGRRVAFCKPLLPLMRG